MTCSYNGCQAEAHTATVEGWTLCDMHLAYVRSASLNVDNPAAEHVTEESFAALLSENLPPAMVTCPTCNGTGCVEAS